MANAFCACGGGGINGNTGITPNALTYKNTKAIILVPLVANDGTENVIQESDFVDGKLPQSFIDGKLNHANYTKRWYLIKNFESTPTNERADPITEQTGNSNNRIVDLGIRSLVATKQLENMSEQRNYERLQCLDLGVFEVDRCGTLLGIAKSGANVFKPAPIGKNTFYSRVIRATESTTPQIQIQYEIKQTVSDGDFEIIPDAYITDTEGYLIDEAESLQNVLVDVSNISATGFTANLRLEAGNFNQIIKGIGWQTSDFALVDSSGASVAITSVTETPANSGDYVFVIPSQTPPETLTLSGAVTGDAYTKEGFELQSTEIPIV